MTHAAERMLVELEQKIKKEYTGLVVYRPGAGPCIVHDVAITGHFDSSDEGCVEALQVGFFPERPQDDEMTVYVKLCDITTLQVFKPLN